MNLDTGEQFLELVEWLGYPFDTKRQHLFNPVGAPNTWANLLQVIHWCYEMIAFFVSNPNVGIGIIEEHPSIEEESKLASEEKN